MKNISLQKIVFIACFGLFISACTNSVDPRQVIGLHIDSDEFKEIIEELPGEVEEIGNRLLMRDAGLVFAYDNERTVERIDIWVLSRPIGRGRDMKSFAAGTNGNIPIKLYTGKVIEINPQQDPGEIKELFGGDKKAFGNGAVIEKANEGFSVALLPRYIADFHFHPWRKKEGGINPYFVSLYEPKESLPKINTRALQAYKLIADIGIEPLPSQQARREAKRTREKARREAERSRRICESASESDYRGCRIRIGINAKIAAAKSQTGFYGKEHEVKEAVKRLRNGDPQCAKLIENGCIEF